MAGEQFKFGGNPNSAQIKPSVSQPVKGEENQIEKESENKPNSYKIYNSEEEYYDKRSVTIMLVANTSLFRKANSKVMERRADYIGSSINSSRTLTANKEEMAAYMPNILGISANHDTFVNRVKQYFNNIQVRVEEIGKTFDIGFHYTHYKDYLKFVKEEEKINAEFDSIDRRDVGNIKTALKIKLDKLNALESTKFRYGYPNNVEDYLIYRHCLLYSPIAKDLALINSDPNIRFYFKDNTKEEERAKKLRREINKAKGNFVSCLTHEHVFESVYILYCAATGKSLSASLAKSQIDKETELDKFSTNEPEKFNALFDDKDKEIKATIEKLIMRGELIRYANNQNITLPDGQLIGANLKEAVMWIKDPNNNSVVTALYAKLKY